MKRTFCKYLALFLILTLTMLCFGGCTAANTSPDTPQTVQASVIEIEKYGHAVLDLTTSAFAKLGYTLGDTVHVRFASYESDMPFFDGYYCAPGSMMLRGSAPDANIAVCINYGDFARTASVAVGDTAEITMVEKAAALALQELCSLQYSNDRADYSDDVTFANFRAVTAGRIADGTLYRSASPVNNRHGRAAFANNLIAAANVATVLNLADSHEDIADSFEAADFRSPYYRSLYESGRVKALDLAGNFFSDDFAVSLAEGLTFLAQNEPPYLLHCTEGKDRAGFASFLLEALMGAALDEIIDDYMLSYRNYYGISKETEPDRYHAVLENNLIAIVRHVTNAAADTDLTQIDLEAAVTKYLLGAGMTEADLAILKEKLS